MSERQSGAVRVMEPSVNMALISLPYISMLHIAFIFFATELPGDVSHFQTFGAFTKKPYKKVYNVFLVGFSCTFCPDVVDLYNKPVVKKVYLS